MCPATPTSLPKTLNLVLADDHRMVLSALHHLLQSRAHLNILAEAQSVAELLALPELALADIVLLDLNLPAPAGEARYAELPGLRALPKLRTLTAARIVVLSMHDESAIVLRALHLGASGFVTKSSPAERLFEAIDAVTQGISYIDPAILAGGYQAPVAPTPALAEPAADLAALSRQEREVGSLLLAGLSQKAISHRLGITPQTTHTYKRRLRSKLQADNDVDLLRKLPAALGLPAGGES